MLCLLEHADRLVCEPLPSQMAAQCHLSTGCLIPVTMQDLPLSHSPAAAATSSHCLHFRACALPLQDSGAAVAQQSGDISPITQAPTAAAAIWRELSTAAAAAAERKRRATLTSPGSSTTTSPRLEDPVPPPKSSPAAAGLWQAAPAVTAPAEAVLDRQTTRKQAEAQAVIQVCSGNPFT